jgi:hypothetical protein
MSVPRGAQGWAYRPDPSDVLSYGVDLSETLISGEFVASDNVAVTLGAEAMALGLTIVEDEGRQPSVAGDGKIIVFWLTVDEAKRNDPTWDGWGRDLPISVAWSTQGTAQGEYQREFVITVRDR